MKTRRVGSTDLILSEIGFGCGGNAGLMVRGDAAEQRRAIAYALEIGITYFDNAPDYGNGAAEEALGQAADDGVPRAILRLVVASLSRDGQPRRHRIETSSSALPV